LNLLRVFLVYNIYPLKNIEPSALQWQEANEDLSGHNVSPEHRGIERIWVSHRAGIAAQSISQPNGSGR
jgi:hypothetical protein